MKSFLKSFLYALHGIWAGSKEQRNFKVQLGAAGVVIVAGFYFSITAIEWCVVLLCIAVVLGLELMNSALENLVDLFTRERNPLAGKVKDMAAGAVLIVSIAAFIIGIIIFEKYLF